MENYQRVMAMSRNLVILVLTPLMFIVLPLSVDAGTTIVYIDPPLTTGLSIGETFPINVTVANVTNLFAWSFQICYKSEVLSASYWTDGPVFKPPDAINMTVIWTDNYNGTHGLIQVDCTFAGEDVPTFNGTTTLATVYFKLKSYGLTVLHLQNTLLLDGSKPYPQDISHTTADGTVRAGSDVAVTKITASKNIVNDTVVRINVTVANYGARSETFNVTLYYNSIEINTQTVTNIAPRASLTPAFVWNTTSVPKGNYTISAKAHPLPNEVNTDDNTLIGGWIVETILGDVTGDYKVDILDIATVAKAYGAYPGNPKWNPNTDLDNSNLIDIIDIAKAAKNYGKEI